MAAIATSLSMSCSHMVPVKERPQADPEPFPGRPFLEANGLLLSGRKDFGEVKTSNSRQACSTLRRDLGSNCEALASRPAAQESLVPTHTSKERRE